MKVCQHAMTAMTCKNVGNLAWKYCPSAYDLSTIHELETVSFAAVLFI